jgi:S1-C subfamily serine protease
VNQTSNSPTGPSRSVPVLRREAIYAPAGPQRLMAVAIVTALASVSFGFALAIFARPMGLMGHCPTVRVVERGAVPLARAPGPVTWLGVHITTEERPGALVVDVVKGTPAEKSGLRGGDRIVALDEMAVRSSAELVRAVRARRPGEAVQVKFERGGELQEVAAVLGWVEREPRARARPHR